ncbi:hypothetical protein F3Y22_tig00111208pilonHSYRG00222 [Hibiscus syriacus]|uniref:Uncharacterized protein n=1 Tax=Hibiscus syriacus TaxID=106335 RepID=A0A6A2YVW5_HIBSY|nr:hypothetical protein F3Y22_tig00111208pilonHSYRG00222 [Hibiscus syriacus]
MPSGRPCRSPCTPRDLVGRHALHALPPAPRVITLALGCPRIARSNGLGRMPSVGWLRMPNDLTVETMIFAAAC